MAKRDKNLFGLYLAYIRSRLGPAALKKAVRNIVHANQARQDAIARGDTAAAQAVSDAMHRELYWLVVKLLTLFWLIVWPLVIVWAVWYASMG